MTKSGHNRDAFRFKEGAISQRIIAFTHRAKSSTKQLFDGGNPCLLVMTENAPKLVPQEIDELTVCQSWPVMHHNEPVVAVRCFTSAGLAIECCGHGLLSAAFRWQAYLQRTEVALLMGETLVPSWQKQDTIWLSFQHSSTTTCSLPQWISDIFPEQRLPMAAATCGGKQSYLVLQWPDNYNLKQLAPALERVSKYSQRALICTSAQPSSGDNTIQLRYFAPQYGVPEDSATGSAMRVLASYWLPRFSSLTAQQCSPAGGFLRTHCADGYTHVGGHCRVGE